MTGCRRLVTVCLAILVSLLVGGCAGTADDVPERPFSLEHLVKTDMDTVLDAHARLTMRYLRVLMGKLYRRNPVQLARGGSGRDIEAAIDWTFDSRRPLLLDSLDRKTSIEALMLAFEPEFQGDRVLAFVEGLRSMLMRAYGNKQDFYMLDRLDPQKLFDAARNIEVAIWRLGHKTDAHGQLLLLSNSLSGPVPNISFERLFGKLIALQDSLALVLAEGDNRLLKNTIQNIATAVFIPI